MAARLDRRDTLETVALAALVAFVAALQLSIAAAGILLAATLACWALFVTVRREPIEVPKMYWPLVAYAGVTLVSAAFSADPSHSFSDAKQLVLFLIVPAVYRLARGARARTVVTAIISVGAVSAVYGVIQYGILNFDHLGRRPHGTLTHYMTYSGLLMLVTCAATAAVIFRERDRTWPALVLPALLVGLVLTSTRSAWVGTCAALALLFLLRDFRLIAGLPVVAALFFAAAPSHITDRAYSMFSLQDPTSRDRVAMLRSGVRIVRDHPLAGVGPDMVKVVYAEYRDPEAVEPLNPHLHNVPMQIAAERGLPALAIWLWFVVRVTRDLARMFRAGRHRDLAATGLAGVAGMLAAGMFEYNFGDSEYLMLFLVLVTLPFAASRGTAAAATAAAR